MTRRRARARIARLDRDAIARDDSVVEALAQRRPVPDGADGVDGVDEVAALLADWCARVDQDLDDAPVVAGAAAPPCPPGRERRGSGLLTRRWAAAAGVLGAVALAGLLAGGQARPDGPPRPPAGVVDSDRAGSATASGQVSDALARAGDLLAQGRLAAAERTLALARAMLPLVRPADDRAALAARLDEVESQLGRARRRAGAAPTTSATHPPGKANGIANGNGSDHGNGGPNGNGGANGNGGGNGNGGANGNGGGNGNGSDHGNGDDNGNGNGNAHGNATGHPIAPVRPRPSGTAQSSHPAAAAGGHPSHQAEVQPARPALRPVGHASTPSANPRAYSHDT